MSDIPWFVTGPILLLDSCVNLALALISCTSKHLCSACNYLIAFDCLMHGTFTGLYVCVYVRLVDSVWGAVTFSHCFLASIVGFLQIELTTVMPLIIALERLVAVVCPVWTNNQDPCTFACVMVLPAIVNAVCMTALYGVASFTTLANRSPAVVLAVAAGLVRLGAMCYPSIDSHLSQTKNCIEDIYTREGFHFSSYRTLTLVPVCWCVYAALWARARRSSQNASASNRQADLVNKKLLRSVLVVVALITFGNLGPTIGTPLLPMLGVSLATTFEICILFVGTSSLLTPPALYIFSSQYRAAIDEVVAKCPFIKRFRQRQPTKVHPATNFDENEK